ncbi:hypothetical protein MC885_007686 [Smutsia gigantea]|nr:hypothetical protein MC885_007686 [Smutsia gigantea]
MLPERRWEASLEEALLLGQRMDCLLRCPGELPKDSEEDLLVPRTETGQLEPRSASRGTGARRPFRPELSEPRVRNMVKGRSKDKRSIENSLTPPGTRPGPGAFLFLPAASLEQRNPTAPKLLQPLLRAALSYASFPWWLLR